MMNVLAELFVGRTAELDAVGEWLAGDGHVVTLRGPGGAGKTTIARRIAAAHDASFVELESCRSTDDVWSALAAVAGTAPAREEVARVVEGKVVVLDNAEHITDCVSEIVANLNHTRFIVTSRERLAVADETLVPVGPMNRAAARELFRRRALAVVPSLDLDDGEQVALDRLLDTLDCLPLAVVLAASRTQIMTPTQIIDRLEAPRTLRDRRADAPRHASVDACVEWSWDLLDDDGRETLKQCTIFRGSFTLADAEAVVESDDWVGDALEELVEQSLVRIDRTSPPRFALYGEVRRFVQRGHGIDDGLLERFVTHFGTAADDPSARVDPFNLLHAFDLGADKFPDIAAQLMLASRQRLWRAGFVRQSLPRFRRVVDDLQPSPAVTARSQLGIAACYEALREDDNVLEALDELDKRIDGLDEATRLHMTAGAAMLRSSCYQRMSDFDQARDQRQRGIAAMAERTDASPLEEVHMLSMCGLGALHARDIEEGREHLSRAVEIASRDGQGTLHARALSWHAAALQMSGDLDAAVVQLERALDLFDGHDDFVSQAQAQYMLCVAISVSDPERALAMTRIVEDLARRAGMELLMSATRITRARLEGGANAAELIRRELRTVRRSPQLHERLSGMVAQVVVLATNEELDAALHELERAMRELEERPHEATAFQQYRAVILALSGDEPGAVDPEFSATVRSALSDGAVPAGAIADWRDPWTRSLFDFALEPLEVLDAVLRRRAQRTVVRVIDDGDIIVTVCGGHVDMRARNLLRRLLLKMLETHEGAPGTPITVDDLLEAGWPDEKMTHESGVRRVYSAIRNLRKLGFEDTIVTDERGYVIAPDVVVEYA